MLPPSRRMLLIGAVVVSLVFCAAWVTFGLSKPGFETVLPQVSDRGSGLRNLALFDEGLVIRASSNERFGRHHPAYALDGQAPAMPNQQWLSAVGDMAPWIEVRFDAPRSIDHVQLSFTSRHEPNALVPKVYSLTCFTARGNQQKLTIRNNADKQPVHKLPCTSASGVRIDFPAQGRAVGEHVRIVELQVWGR